MDKFSVLASVLNGRVGYDDDMSTKLSELDTSKLEDDMADIELNRRYTAAIANTAEREKKLAYANRVGKEAEVVKAKTVRSKSKLAMNLYEGNPSEYQKHGINLSDRAGNFIGDIAGRLLR